MGSLVVTLRYGDGALIGKDIEVKVTSLDRGRVSLRINAPDNVRISRTIEVQRPLPAPGIPRPIKQPDELEATLQAVRSAKLSSVRGS